MPAGFAPRLRLWSRMMAAGAIAFPLIARGGSEGEIACGAFQTISARLATKDAIAPTAAKRRARPSRWTRLRLCRKPAAPRGSDSPWIRTTFCRDISWTRDVPGASPTRRGQEGYSVVVVVIVFMLVVFIVMVVFVLVVPILIRFVFGPGILVRHLARLVELE